MAHAFFNLFIMSFLIISIQFPDESTYFQTNNTIRIAYNKTPYFSKQRKSEIKYLDSALVINSSQKKYTKYSLKSMKENIIQINFNSWNHT